MENVSEETLATKAKSVEPASGSQAAPVNKFEANRIANKLRKKRAHRRTLRRSNTKG
jgi:hypothetical protein